MDENNSLYELESFVEKIKMYKLENCNFQISLDFNKESISIDSGIAMIVLHALLSNLHSNQVFIDDLILQRFQETSSNDYKNIISLITQRRLPNFIANYSDYKDIIIWGAGIQTKRLIENSHFFKKAKIKCIVDENIFEEDSSKKFLGYDLVPPSILHECDNPVLISAVQRKPFIYSYYKSMGLDDSRLINKLIL